MSFIDRLFPRHESKIQLELYKYAYRSLLVGMFSPTVMTAIILAAFGSTLNSHGVAIWLPLMAAATLSSLVMRYRFTRLMKKQNPDEGAMRRAYLELLLHFAIIGTAWGSIALLSTPEQPVQNAVLLVIYLGIMAVGASNLGVHSLHGYFVALLLGGLFVFPILPAAFGDRASALIGGIGFFYVVVASAALNAHRTFVHSIRLQFRNDELLLQTAAAAERAERANRDKSLFLAAASHDLRQPVHALLLLIEALRQRSNDVSLRELLDYMQQAGTTIGKLFSSLMELSRLESGSERAEPAPLVLSEVLHTSLERQRLEAEQAGLTLKLRLGRGTETAMIYTDRVLLERILDNLLSNALRYTRTGGVLLTARQRHDGKLWIEVWDSGIGIAANEVERIFEPYYQIANPERDRRKGLGLGMAIVKRTAELLGITLYVNSRSGHGSCFRLEISNATPLAATPPTQAPTAPNTAPQLKGRRVLVIDDDPMVLQAMGVLLGSWGIDYRCVTDEHSALDITDRQGWQPEAIVCDYRLPGERNGIDLLDTLTECHPGAAAILQTGELAPQVRDAAEDAGYLVLTKPVQGATLAATLETVLGPH